MLLWFVILAPVLVAEIFQSPMADYRVVAVGAALPLIELAVFGGPRYLHTMAVAMGLMAVVMLATSNRRLVRRRLLGIPIGLLLHLVLDFTWADQRLLWWPAFGFDFGEGGGAFNRPIELGLLLEIVALGVGYWAYRRYELDEPENLDLLLRSGRLNRAAMPG